jgi:low affinity Fe/Cu permease
VYHDSPFTRFAKWTSRAAGHPTTFVIAVHIILVWAATGPVFGMSDTWQLVMNGWHDHYYIPDGVPTPEHSK